MQKSVKRENAWINEKFKLKVSVLKAKGISARKRNDRLPI